MRVASVDAIPEAPARLAGWLDAGHHGDMTWLTERTAERADPATLWPAARSVVMLGMSYAPKTDPLALAEHPEIGRISVYAQGQDYHDVVKRALKALGRWLAEQAGAGGYQGGQSGHG